MLGDSCMNCTLSLTIWRVLSLTWFLRGDAISYRGRTLIKIRWLRHYAMYVLVFGVPTVPTFIAVCFWNCRAIAEHARFHSILTLAIPLTSGERIYYTVTKDILILLPVRPRPEGGMLFERDQMMDWDALNLSNVSNL